MRIETGQNAYTHQMNQQGYGWAKPELAAEFVNGWHVHKPGGHPSLSTDPLLTSRWPSVVRL